MKLTEWDKVVLSLAEHKEWRRAYELERKVVENEMVGSEADTRLYELFDKRIPDKGEVKRMIDEAEYTVQTKKDKGRWWRAFLSKEKPQPPVYYVKNPLTGEMITTTEYAKLS